MTYSWDFKSQIVVDDLPVSLGYGIRWLQAVCQAFGPSDMRRTETFPCLSRFFKHVWVWKDRVFFLQRFVLKSLKCWDSGWQDDKPATVCWRNLVVFWVSPRNVAIGIAGGSWWCEANCGQWSGRKCRGIWACEWRPVYWIWVCQRIWKLRHLRGLQCYSQICLFRRDYRCDKLDIWDLVRGIHFSVDDLRDWISGPLLNCTGRKDEHCSSWPFLLTSLIGFKISESDEP